LLDEEHQISFDDFHQNTKGNLILNKDKWNEYYNALIDSTQIQIDGISA